MTTGPEQAGETVNDTYGDNTNERDVREIRHEHATPEGAYEDAPGPVHTDMPDQDAGAAGDAADQDASDATDTADAADQDAGAATDTADHRDAGATTDAADYQDAGATTDAADHRDAGATTDAADYQDAGATTDAADYRDAGDQDATDAADHQDAGAATDAADYQDAGDYQDVASPEEAHGTTQIPQQPSGIASSGAEGSDDADADVGGPLLTDGEELRSSWQQILAGFVDDPRGSVVQAATMVEETARTLVTTIQERERVLRGAWEGNGAAADTEKLRIALGKYRKFFEKITRL